MKKTYAATTRKEAWNIADDIFPTDYIIDSRRTAAAGYDVYTSTQPGTDAWISDLQTRLEVNLPDGSTVNVWIDDTTDDTDPDTTPGGETVEAPTESEVVKALDRMTVNPIYAPDVCIKVTTAIFSGVLAQGEAEQTVFDALRADVHGVTFDIIARHCEANGIVYGSISDARAYFVNHGKPGEGHFVVDGYVGASAGREAEFIAPCVKYLLQNAEENARYLDR